MSLIQAGNRTAFDAVILELAAFIELPTRAVRIAGITANPAEGWMLQIARNACDAPGTARQLREPLLRAQIARHHQHECEMVDEPQAHLFDTSDPPF